MRTGGRPRGRSFVVGEVLGSLAHGWGCGGPTHSLFVARRDTLGAGAAVGVRRAPHAQN